MLQQRLTTAAASKCRCTAATATDLCSCRSRITYIQLGMVRRERWSMATGTIVGLVTKFAKWCLQMTCCKGRFLTVLLCLVWLLQVEIQAYASDTTVVDPYADEAFLALGHGAHAHASKFGERQQPTRKKNAASIYFGVPKKVGSVRTRTTSTTTTTTTTTSTTTESSVNSLLSKSNNTVGRELVIGGDKELGSKIKIVGNVSTTSERQRERELYTIAVSDNKTFLVTPRSRQSKQLIRREDNNIESIVTTTTTLENVRGNISKADRLEMSTEFFVVPTMSTVSSTRIPGRAGPKARGVVPGSYHPNPGQTNSRVVGYKTVGASSNVSVTPPTIVSIHPPFLGLRKEPWVVPVLVLSSLTMLMMGAFEVFVLFKAWRTSPSRRHLFLGQMLLLGLFACASLGAVITAQPSLLSCGTIRFGVGVAYALVFAALLVKCVFLISLNGGVYLPAPYQGLLLLFAVLIQVAIGAQWLLTQPPEVYTTSVPVLGSGFLSPTVASHTNYTAFFYPTAYTTPDGPEVYTRIAAVSTVLIPLCKTQFSELLFSLIYIVFLIVFIAVLAIKSRGIRDNYREATYIGLAIGGAIPIWLGWMLCGLAVAERHKDACVAFGLVATSATVFLVMFMPKGRQLAAMGKEGLYVEDREEQFSSLSRAGSGYSPSFFHFKPIKYGVMGAGLQNSGTNTGNGVSMKHCSNANNGGDRVALVTAAPPSYTRMYHYFPAHLTAHPFCYYPQPPPPLPLPPTPIAPPTITQLSPHTPLTLKQLGNSLTSMTQAHIAKTLRYPGMFIRPDETNLYTTLEPTLSSNPNVYFQRGGAVHPGMMY